MLERALRQRFSNAINRDSNSRQKAYNAREGIETYPRVTMSINYLSGQKAYNAREGIETHS